MKKKQESKIVNWNNYKPSPGETNTGEVMFIPDESYTIPEIFEKFRRGISLPLEREVHYTDTDDFDDIDLRQIAKDPYDIDNEIVRDRIERRILKGAKKEDGLPERTPAGKVSSDGVKDDKQTPEKD